MLAKILDSKPSRAGTMGSIIIGVSAFSSVFAQQIFIFTFCSVFKSRIQQNTSALNCYLSSSMLMAEYKIAMSFPFTIQLTTSMINVLRKLSEVLETFQCLPRLLSDQ